MNRTTHKNRINYTTEHRFSKNLKPLSVAWFNCTGKLFQRTTAVNKMILLPTVKIPHTAEL